MDLHDIIFTEVSFVLGKRTEENIYIKMNMIYSRK